MEIFDLDGIKRLFAPSRGILLCVCIHVWTIYKGKSEKVLCESLCQKMREAYKAYFSMPVGYQDKSWAPHFTGISHLQETAASPDSEEDIGDPDYGFTDVVEERRPY